MQRRFALITDGFGRKSLSAVRSLGRAGFEIALQSDERLTPGFWSRYTKICLHAPDGRNAMQSLNTFLTEFNSTHDRPPILLPMEEASMRWAYSLTAQQALTLLPPRSSFEAANSKWATSLHASSCGVPTPTTRRLENFSEFEKILSSSGKWILKPEIGKGSLGQLRDDTSKDLSPSQKERLWREFAPYLFQERLDPQGAAIGAAFVFDRGGRCAGQFAYQRLHEYPITGGPSTDRISIDGELAEEALRLGRLLLEKWNWVGVAHVEFKIDSRTKQLNLLEVNPRFWGSLELAVRSGVDFPLLYANLAEGKDAPLLATPRTGTRVRWTIPGDLLRWMNTSRGRREPIWQFLRGFISLSEEWNQRDPLPYLVGWLSLVALLFKPRYWRLLRR